jgi:pimeloyl-ACP methyl ester carboxylesterase
MNDVLPEPRLEGSYRLARGRRIGFAEWGRADGIPVLWFHGTPGGRHQIAPGARRLAAEMEIRLISLERPGIGGSSRHLYENVAGWAEDVGTIVDRLGIDRFACVGLSGGGPYVLACAARYPDRMFGGAVLGGVAPNRGSDAISGGLVGLLAPFAPAITTWRRPLGDVLHLAARTLMPVRTQAFGVYIAMSPAGDQRVFARPEMRAMFIDDIVRGTRRQLHAPVLDLVLFSREWGFSLRDITVPICFWHGDADQIVPLAHAEHMAALVPDAELRVRHGESHLGALGAAEEIYETLLAFLEDEDDERVLSEPA